MAITNASHQWGSNSLASLGAYCALFTAAAGTTGANEASGSGYSRASVLPWTPDALGDNVGTQVTLSCGAGDYVEGGLLSTASGLLVPAPTSLAATPSTSGGTLAAGTYYYVTTAVNFAGETVASNEVSVTLTGSTSSVALIWTLPQGAMGSKVYRGTVSNTENELLSYIGGFHFPAAAGGWYGSVYGNTFTDIGTTPLGSATPPGSNTAVSFIASAAFVGGTIGVVGTGASIDVTPTITD